MPWVARRTLSKVKSRAISPRQPDVPNLIISSAFPVKSALLQRINVTHKKHPQERKHRTQNHACVLLQHLLVNHRPGIKKYYFDVEKNEQHCDEVKLYRHSPAAFADGEHAAFVRRILDW